MESGLSLVKSLIELHGGSILLNSEIGVGSEFIINLPILKVKEKENETESFVSVDKVERVQIQFSDIYSNN